jgi:hypothetical protein
VTSIRVRAANARTMLLRVGWAACATLLALGSAGIVTSMQHQPGTAARAELTYAADNRIAPGLAGSADDLRALTADVDGLGTLGTRSLAAITGGDIPAMQKSITDGKAIIKTIESKTAALRARLAALPGVGPGAEGRLGGLSLLRYETLTGALDATGGLSDKWDTLTAGSLAAIQLETSLLDHDTSTAAAAALGKAARYADAVKQLATSDLKLDLARAGRDAMSASVDDVTVLTSWIDRNADYDAALRKVYTLLVTSKGKVTKAVQDAYDALKVATAALPGDTRALVVIMGDLARGGLNQAVISIEEAKGRLSDAVDAFASVGSGGSGGSGGASPSTGP